ncbi:MAG TPA: metalloregulator ArsR/SmtB family transcription factor [Gemmatimonadales bacterium]|jgi:DNA-binding transcriptional ArsR family regulator|nr:metalloregulator ArsR/SmtB family transcription factor [Gemmatimonadales bacterium]
MVAPASSTFGTPRELSAENVAGLLKALADPLRNGSSRLTSAAPMDEVSFHELVEHFSMPQSSLSHHLRILVRAGILERRRTGTWSRYRLSREALRLIQAGPVFAAVAIAFNNNPEILAALAGILLLGLAVSLLLASYLSHRRSPSEVEVEPEAGAQPRAPVTGGTRSGANR